MLIYVVPGSLDFTSEYRKVARHFRSRGYKVKTTPFGFYAKGLKEVAEHLADDLGKVKDNVVILSHSAGGVIVKYALEHHPELRNKVLKVLACCTPFHGSEVAKLGTFIPVFKDLVPGSPVLRALNRRKASNHLFISIMPLLDTEVIPLSSERLQGAEHVQLPIRGHSFLSRNPKVLHFIEQELRKLDAADKKPKRDPKMTSRRPPSRHSRG